MPVRAMRSVEGVTGARHDRKARPALDNGPRRFGESGQLGFVSNPRQVRHAATIRRSEPSDGKLGPVRGGSGSIYRALVLGLERKDPYFDDLEPSREIIYMPPSALVRPQMPF
jgi:hypothetical protein